jgi:hypothetical protein
MCDLKIIGSDFLYPKGCVRSFRLSDVSKKDEGLEDLSIMVLSYDLFQKLSSFSLMQVTNV